MLGEGEAGMLKGANGNAGKSGSSVVPVGPALSGSPSSALVPVCCPSGAQSCSVHAVAVSAMGNAPLAPWLQLSVNL